MSMGSYFEVDDDDDVDIISLLPQLSHLITVSHHSNGEEYLRHSVYESITSPAATLITTPAFSILSTFLWGRSYETLCIWMDHTPSCHSDYSTFFQHLYGEKHLRHSVYERIMSLSLIIIAVSDFSSLWTFLWGRTVEALCIWRHYVPIYHYNYSILLQRSLPLSYDEEHLSHSVYERITSLSIIIIAVSHLSSLFHFPMRKNVWVTVYMNALRP
jgi:hypothetical protein